MDVIHERSMRSTVKPSPLGHVLYDALGQSESIWILLHSDGAVSDVRRCYGSIAELMSERMIPLGVWRIRSCLPGEQAHLA